MPVVRALAAALVVAVLAVLPAAGREVYGLSAEDLGLYLGDRLLAGWQVDAARRVVDRMLADDPDSDRARELDARVLFFEGRYDEALDRLQALGARGPFRDLVAATADAARGFRSRAGHGFAVFWSDPRDELLVDGALAALGAARAAVADALGFAPEAGGPVRVEVYPTVSAFTAVSTLTRAEVETSGTIGLCKFDRIMLTSPRATLWGYRWRDTLCHEYVHLAVYRLSRGRAPIWVHEGVAKYLEGAWRGAAGELDPASQALLARRLAADDLIPLEAMSPSVAKLPSAEDTALAFAEVGTMIAFLAEERGPDAVRRLVEALGAGADDRTALETVWGGSFDGFEAAWQDWVRSLPLERGAVQVIGLALADHGSEDADAPGAIPDPDARDYARLGDLLRARGRTLAARVEYGKAYAADPAAPGVASRYAGALLAGQRYADALDVAADALALYPDLPVLWYRKARALAGLGRPADALAALDQLFEINPFHVPGRELAAEQARAAGRVDEAAAHEAALALLAAPGPDHPAGRTQP